METSYVAKPSDWDEIATYFKDEGNIVFPYLIPGNGIFILSLNKHFMKCSRLPYVGDPFGRTFVSVLHRGCDLFSSDFSDGFVAKDLEERLGLSATEALGVAQLFTALNDRKSV